MTDRLWFVRCGSCGQERNVAARQSPLYCRFPSGPGKTPSGAAVAGCGGRLVEATEVKR